ncbi:cation channel sperm-associated auxiliary subunit gamma isoform X7 [Peromyscus californicus insignis]|uniref:cation channel sperm-associated auxiliary subunit gamma isoform X7 n=1 Tax=Peromyscus californicus insignis TaxID=564181 RepID=UPI0022A6B228|nr:cation channel sperm-associated auxiliary subunit gamma isoform X7 [Peromyscus californicus insignis]
MDRTDEKRWREKVSVGTVRIAKSAWVWGDGRSCGQRTVYDKESLRNHEQSRGEDKYWGKERVIYEREHGEQRAKREDRDEERPPGEDRSRGEGRSPGEERSRGEGRSREAERPRDQERFPKEKAQAQERAGAEGQAGAEEKPPGRERERGRGPEQKQEGQVAQDPGRGRSQDLGRGQERKGSEEPTSCQTQCPIHSKGRGQERKSIDEPISGQTQRQSQSKGRGQEGKSSEEPISGQTQRQSQSKGRGQEGKSSEEPISGQTQRQSQSKGRGQEGKSSEEPISGQTQRQSQSKGRGQERKSIDEPISSQTQRQSQSKGRGQEGKSSEEPISGQTRRQSQGRGRSQEGKSREKSISGQTRRQSRSKGRSQEGKSREKSISGQTRRQSRSKGRSQERKSREKPISGQTRRRSQGRGRSVDGGSSCMVCWPVMCPVSPVWPRKPNLWAFWVPLLVLLLSWKSWAEKHFQNCRWLVVLNKFERVGALLSKDRFMDQEPMDTVTEVFQKLVDSPIDPREKYMGFPYYLKVSFSCMGKNDEELVRKGHLMGLRPVILISYKYPVNFYRWKIENLQIQMEAAPLRSAGFCIAEVMCALNWYVPMPTKNGSVVMSVDIRSNGLGPYIPPRRFYVNINGYMKRDASGNPIFTIGYETFALKSDHFKRSKSRPLWYTQNHSPVLILGGIEDEKTILLSDTNFQDFSLVELSIDSCWVGSYYCPILDFSATIHDAISTESTLFIRQNQLVYYFTGSYSALFDSSYSSSSWVRVLASECIKKLCPVFVDGNGSEYILALTTGKNEGYIHIGTITATIGYTSFFWRTSPRTPLSNTWSTLTKETWLLSPKEKRNFWTPSFTNLCPFKVMRLRDLPKKQHLARQELYHAPPPLVSESLGFHNNKTLAVYQGLVYYLLWLHSKYDKPYADPVHDPTWRWWEHKSRYKDYYFYLSSNWLAAEGVYIDMSSYQKLYNISHDHGLPEMVFLDKGTSFSFTVFLTAHEDTFKLSASSGSSYQVEKKLAVAVVVADPECLDVTVKQDVLLNRKAVLYKITIKDKKVCYDQGISGHNLKKTSLMVKVLGSSGKCFQTTYLGTSTQGHLMVPLLIGCPPGKRLAFDVTYTILHSQQLNKHYFDCVVSNPEMPCFLFRDLFQPFFLVQDMVTGDSGRFLGSYLLKVVGGGPTMDTIRDYTEEEIYRFNSPLDKTNSLIWKTKAERTTQDKKFYIMSEQSPGIEWLCLENSPCHDITPRSIFAPEFFLKLLVSNRGVDTSSYCDYQLIFILHLHGLPLSAQRSLFIVLVSTSLFVGLVVFYILFCLLWPHIVKAWVSLRWKINNIMAAESFYTYATSSAALSLQSQSVSEPSFKAPSNAGSKVDNASEKEVVA